MSDSTQAKPVNVLHFICSTGFYGAEKWILALANNLDRDNVHSELVVTKETHDHDLELVREFRGLQLTAHELPMNGRFDFRVIGALVRLIRERNIDIIHSHGYKSDILGVIAARLAGVKSMSTPHGFETSEDWKLNLFIKLGCVSLRYFDVVVPLSRDLEKEIISQRVPADKIVYIRNGVDLKGIEFRGARSVPAGQDRVIGFIGQMIARKNVQDLLDVFDRISVDYPNTRLELLGDGDSREMYQQHAAGLASAEKIRFLGFVNNPVDYLRTFDLFVMSSRLEGIPRCLMEAMALGVPVAAYDIPGIDQLIEHEASGMLAPFGDKAALEDCWRRILDDPALSHSLTVVANQRINDRYSAARMAREYWDLYNALMHGNDSLLAQAPQ